MKTDIAQEYWYDLPEELIAQEPVNPRDSSKLLVYNTKTNEVIFDTFSNLVTHLPPSTTLTLNDAKVVPARVTLFKETGGKIVVLFLINEWISTKQGPIPCFLDRKGVVGDKLYFKDKSFCTIQRQEEGLFFVSWEGKAEDLLQKLDMYGGMPVPPYIKHSPLSRDELMEKYQTVFAKHPGSSAAPTASLHFTPSVFKNLEAKGIKKQYITLHVGLGTFAPLTAENLRTKTLHHEWYEVPSDFTEATRGKDITAVGTTVARTLESIYQYPEGDVRRHQGETNLFIFPPFRFKAVNHLITNFHLPSSSLMMLVDAFLQDKKAEKNILDLYALAIKEKLRFYSFGDAMLIL
jgi:S-adenosylmethionine:tRNA ribosyltransferase-isomerase